MSHLGTGPKFRDDFCNWCDDMKHCMSAPCSCQRRGVACKWAWCPVLETEDEYTPPPVPTFE